jgi:hypothetical protein
MIGSILDEEGVLKDLYAPIRAQLDGAKGALGKLEFGVTRHVDLEAWCRRGEELIDLRIGSELKGKGSLRHKAEEYLLPAWKTGSADDIVEALERFRDDISDALKRSGLQSIPADQRRTWFYKVADWLRDTSHITVQYGIEYEGVSIEHLSPGTRGVVLLLLYLAIDRNDTRPLIINQPEENLDPNSVYAELVPHFRQARKRRQIIVVTHNANLVVNTDADQVIVAKAERKPGMALPLIHYQTGAIENKGIRAAICELLEGGQRAFLDRERRYRLKWGESLALETIGAEPPSETGTL